MDTRPHSGPPRGGDIDAQLIRALQEDGRTSVRDLARLLGISRGAVAQRLRSLTEHDGLRVVAALDPRFAGDHVLTHVMVNVEGPAGPIAERITELPSTVFVSIVSGGLPIAFESRHGSVEELHTVLDRVRSIPEVRRVRVTTYAEILSGFFVARERTDITLDDLDHALVELLQYDGRASFRALADAVHLSPSSARARVHRLVDAGVIRISALKTGGVSGSRLAIGIGITARGETAPIRQRILDCPAIDFAARTHGPYDFVGTLVGASAASLLAEIEALRALPEVDAVESWTHYDVVKEDYARALGRVSGA